MIDRIYTTFKLLLAAQLIFIASQAAPGGQDKDAERDIAEAAVAEVLSPSPATAQST